MSVNPSESSIQRSTVLLWVDWLPKSNNEIRRSHWSANYAEDEAARLALLLSLRSSPAAEPSLTKIITLLDSSRSRTESAKPSALTTEKEGLSSLNTPSVGQKSKEQ